MSDGAIRTVGATLAAEPVVNSLITRSPDLGDPVSLLERRVLSFHHVPYPPVTCTSRCRHSSTRPVQICVRAAVAAAVFESKEPGLRRALCGFFTRLLFEFNSHSFPCGRIRGPRCTPLACLSSERRRRGLYTWRLWPRRLPGRSCSSWSFSFALLK